MSLSILLVFLAIAATLVVMQHEEAVSVEAPEGPYVGALEVEAPDAGGVPHAPIAPLTSADPAGRDAVYDPQRSAMQRSFAGGEGDAGLPRPFAPVTRAARITRHVGALPMPADAACEVRVLPVRAEDADCLVRVMCASEILYPNPSQTAGYARCRIEAGVVRGLDDPAPTEADGDPMIDLDLARGTVTVEDQRAGETVLRVTLRLD